MTINRRDWLAASGTMLAAACARRSESAISSKDQPAERPDIPALLQLASVPGIAIATVHRGDVSVEGFGVRRAGTDDKVTGDTVFAAASLSKPVFASIVMQLAAEGTIDLTRPLASYLPLPNPADERAKGITATHVLSHSSGWRNWRNAPDDALTADFEPGSKFSYSGEGYFFLQRVVEKLTGQGLSRLARERVFTPLGMKASGFMWRADLDAALASPHTSRGQPIDSFNAKIGKAFAGLVAEMGKPVEEWTTADVEKALPRVDASIAVLPNNLVPNAAASLLTTARDYGTFVRWLLGAGPLSGGRAILDRMIVQRSTINEALGWGSGIGLEHAGGRDYVWHWGDNPGFKNFVVGEPATGSATVIFTNGNAGQRVYERVIRARTGVDHPAFLWL
jgi:CubicO group peptidase (beta-lactamase class C family)